MHRRTGAGVRVLVLGAIVAIVIVVLSGCSPFRTHAPEETTPSPTHTAHEVTGLDSVSPVVSSAGFTHPGVFVNLDELKVTKRHVVAGDEPWVDDFEQLASSAYATRNAPDFTSFARADATDPEAQPCSTARSAGCVTFCGVYNIPDVGCSDAQADGRAAYGQALMYWYTGEVAYAQSAVAILNAYASHFRGNSGQNGPLMTAWTAEQMVRGAELIRYIYKPAPGEVEFDVDGFSNMLRTALVPTLTTFDYGRAYGNWKLSAADGLMNVAVFLDDRGLYEHAVAMWRERVKSYIYLSSDGALPTPPENEAGLYQTPTALQCQWLSDKVRACQTTPKTNPDMVFQNGQTQETCRDFAHTSMGLSGIINAAESAWIQGQDLYGEQQERIIAGVLYTLQVAQSLPTLGLPRDFCDGVSVGVGSDSLSELAADVVYNAYAVRKGATLSAIPIPGYPTPSPDSHPLADFIATHRSDGAYAGNLVTWDGLTHHLASAPF